VITRAVIAFVSVGVAWGRGVKAGIFDGETGGWSANNGFM
jgi:hypothetical protein